MAVYESYPAIYLLQNQQRTQDRDLLFFVLLMISAADYDTDADVIPLFLGIIERLPTGVVFNECERFVQCLPMQSLNTYAYTHTYTHGQMKERWWMDSVGWKKPQTRSAHGCSAKL